MATAGRIRVGVIGAGGIAQGVHLPSLRQLSGLAEVVSYIMPALSATPSKLK